MTKKDSTVTQPILTVKWNVSTSFFSPNWQFSVRDQSIKLLKGLLGGTLRTFQTFMSGLMTTSIKACQFQLVIKMWEVMVFCIIEQLEIDKKMPIMILKSTFLLVRLHVHTWFQV